MADREAGPRRTFGLAVGGGLVAGGLAAVAGNNAFADSAADTSATGAIANVSSAIGEASAPLVTSVALVLLASWGVVLVTRGRFRRAITWLGLVVSVGLLAAALGAWLQAPGEVRDVLEASGAPDATAGRTAWAYLAVLAGVIAAAASFVAVRNVRTWPEMGRRYDAPGDQAVESDASSEEQTNLDLWRAIDEGHDPTDRPPV